MFMPLHRTFYNISSLFREHIVLHVVGTCWSILQGLGQGWEGAFCTTSYQDGIWIWEAKNNKGRCERAYLPRDSGVSSKDAERTVGGIGANRLHVSKVFSIFHLKFNTDCGLNLLSLFCGLILFHFVLLMNAMEIFVGILIFLSWLTIWDT